MRMRAVQAQIVAIVAIMLGSAGAEAQERQATSFANMSASQMGEDAEAKIAEMNEMLKAGFQALEASRAGQDVAQTTCIADALTPMKGLMKLAERNKIALQEAASRNDRDGAEHEAIKIAIAHNKFIELDAQVRSCGGPDSDGTVDGRPVIEKVLDSDLPEYDPTGDLKDVEVLMDRPVSASQSK